MPDVDTLAAEYLQRFGMMPPEPVGLPEDAMVAALQLALERGTPLTGDDFEVPGSPDVAY